MVPLHHHCQVQSNALCEREPNFVMRFFFFMRNSIHSPGNILTGLGLHLRS